VQFPLDASSVALYAARAAGTTYSFSGHTLHQLDLMPDKLAAATFVTVGSEFEKRVFRERYGERWSSRIHVRRLGVPPRDRSSDAQPAVVASVGTLTGKKGHDVLLRAIAHVSDARLELVGDGPDRPQLESLADELGIRNRVTFHGPLGHSRTLETIARATAFALCCRKTVDGDHDCLPVALMDAMSLGVPCVSSAAFGIPELIEDGASGLLAPPEDDVAVADAVGRLLADPSRAATIGAAGREVVRERYDLQRNTAALADLFAESIG
jgi:colanic acid/amylovoran biosynthesis glycosyltransferase